MNLPAVSVVLPAYNSEKYIAKAIEVCCTKLLPISNLSYQ
jgi:hypothetical protein